MTELNSNFWERYYGRYFKYYSDRPPQLVDYYTTKAETNDKTWVAAINPSYQANVLSPSRFRWRDDTSVDPRLCPPEYRFYYEWMPCEAC